MTRAHRPRLALLAGAALAAAAAVAHADPPPAPAHRVQAAAPVMPVGPQVAEPLVPLTPTRVVTSATELEDLLRSDFTGRVIVPRDADWEMKRPCGAHDELGRCVDTPMRDIPLRSGVQLLGERGPLGSRPVLRARYKLEGYSLFTVVGNDVRVEGLHIQGPAASSRDPKQPYVTGVNVVQDPVARTGVRVVIADNEMDEWIAGAVGVQGTVSVQDPAEYTGPRITRADAAQVRIERNYLHHNARDGGGYGVVVGGNAYATITGNVFDFNRHDVTSDGSAYNGYIARFNYVLQGGFRYGSNGYYGQHFDVHGTGTPAEAAQGHHDGGRAGEYYEVVLNTVRGEQDYGGFLGIGESTRAAFELRGRTATEAVFAGNVLVHDDTGEAVRLKRGSDRSLDTSRPATFNLRSSGNRFDTDFSTELAAGDFDGDGRTDVFLANGTGWFYSRAGIRPWEFLRPSDKRVRDLAFADVDGDGVTDVLSRDQSGALGYVKSGSAAGVTPLTTTPAAISDLRFGDFDADGLTDIFATLRGQWYVRYGKTGVWTPVQTSSRPLSELLFGDFDRVPGTDVATVLRKEWAYSSGATGSWARLGPRRADSFADAVAADLDGNGTSDIAFGDATRWRVSRDGRSALAGVRSAGVLSPFGPLRRLLVGRFDGGAQATVLGFEQRVVNARVATGERLVMWRLGGGNAPVPRSEQNMR